MTKKGVVQTETAEEHELKGKAIEAVLTFLQMFMPVTLAKRVIAVVLLAAGIPSMQVTEISGLCERSIRSLKKAIKNSDTGTLFEDKKGRGRKSKVINLEEEMIAEVEKENYHSRQEIADMIWEKFHIRLSVASVGRLLKKTAFYG